MLVHQVWGSSYEVVNKSGKPGKCSQSDDRFIEKRSNGDVVEKKETYSEKVGLSATEELNVRLDVILGASFMWYLRMSICFDLPIKYFRIVAASNF